MRRGWRTVIDGSQGRGLSIQAYWNPTPKVVKLLPMRVVAPRLQLSLSEYFWPTGIVTGSGMVPGSNTGAHTILVTGLQYDANGNLTNVIVNDTGTGQCSRSVPAATFNGALIGGANNYVVTNNPIW